MSDPKAAPDPVPGTTSGSVPDSAPGPVAGPIPNAAPKVELRAAMRAVRRAVADQPERSARIVAELDPLVADASVVMVFAAVHGEPDLAELAERCRRRGQAVVVPEDEPDPARVDVVVVPGVAFTVAGDRLGQGGGWYDRFLPRLRAGTPMIGVAFREQLLDAVPVDPHDVRVDRVVVA